MLKAFFSVWISLVGFHNLGAFCDARRRKRRKPQWEKHIRSWAELSMREFASCFMYPVSTPFRDMFEFSSLSVCVWTPFPWDPCMEFCLHLLHDQANETKCRSSLVLTVFFVKHHGPCGLYIRFHSACCRSASRKSCWLRWHVIAGRRSKWICLQDTVAFTGSLVWELENVSFCWTKWWIVLNFEISESSFHSWSFQFVKTSISGVPEIVAVRNRHGLFGDTHFQNILDALRV